MNKSILYYSHLAYRAMLKEVDLTPKPGLVDRHSNGAHKDMTLSHFYYSAQAIAPYFNRFILAGIETHSFNENRILAEIRPIGIMCEQAMFKATNGINTHKGSIFSLGLVCVAIGRLLALNQTITPRAISEYVAQFCYGLSERELSLDNQRMTAGQRLFIKYGLTGARGEAESGFATVLNVALPTYLDSLSSDGMSEDMALHQALLSLMAINDDTNVVSRGGLDALAWLQDRSQQFMLRGGVTQLDYLSYLNQFDLDCIERNISPGGCADLLILTWFLGQLTS